MEHFTVEELKQMAEAQHLLDSMEEIGPERRRELMAIVRALAELARENSVAREYLERRLVGVAHSLPSEVETFRACYLDGDQRESARKIGRRLHMDICTVPIRIEPLVDVSAKQYPRIGRRLPGVFAVHLRQYCRKEETESRTPHGRP